MMAVTIRPVNVVRVSRVHSRRVRGSADAAHRRLRSSLIAPASEISTRASRQGDIFASRYSGRRDHIQVSADEITGHQCPGRSWKVMVPRLTQRDFERLLEFRVALRRFQRWSEDQAQAAGLTHVQHQLLVAIKGHAGDMPPTVGDLAGYLLLRPHSTVELVDRAEAAGLVERAPDSDDGRVVRVRLTTEGERILQQLTAAHLDRLHELAVVLDELVTRHGGRADSLT